MAAIKVEPVVIPPSEVSHWSEKPPFMMRVAELCATYLPRGRGAIPRKIGQSLGQSWRAVFRTRDDELLAVEPSNLDTYMTILRDGTWEPHVLDACLAAIRPGDVFYDIGANVGYVSIAVASQQKQSSVISFEPQSGLARAIAISALLNRLDNVQVLSTAVGRTEGNVDLFVPSHGIHASFVSREQGARSIQCRLISLDEQIAAGHIPPCQIMKIDVEGAEFEAFRGAQKLIRDHSPIIVFESDANSERFGYSRTDLLTWLSQQADYRYFDLGEFNLLAAPPERQAEFIDKYPPDAPYSV